MIFAAHVIRQIMIGHVISVLTLLDHVITLGTSHVTPSTMILDQSAAGVVLLS